MTKKVMVVEDSSIMLMVIKKFIHAYDANINIIEARSGGESVEKYKKETPDLVFMDILMPGMDGISALEFIKKHDPNAKVIMCTFVKELAQEEKARKSGCLAYFIKPIEKQTIFDILKANL